MQKKRIVTSALPYVNNIPHIGNIIGCVLSGDVYARYSKKNRIDAIHICGTDEFGTATEMEAIAKNCHPMDICNVNRIEHKKIYDWFDIHFDNFGKTTSQNHILFTQEVFLKIRENGYLEEKEISQMYCEADQMFLADRYIIGQCNNCSAEGAKGDQCEKCGSMLREEDLINPVCFLCKKTPIFKKSHHIFLRLDLLQSRIKDFVNESTKSWSKIATADAKDWCNKELISRCITRDLRHKWGVPVPLKGFEDKVLYVWFDAPIGYISFIKELSEEYLKDFELVEFMGRDNVSFHSIFFPGMMLAAGIDFFPKQISATYYLKFENEKISKSKNHGVFTDQIIKNLLGNDSMWRYYLCKIRPETNDTNFSTSDFLSYYSTDLINTIGNFVNRVLKYINNFTDGCVRYEVEIQNKNISDIQECYNNYIQAMDEINMRKGIECTVMFASLGNTFLQGYVKNDKKERNTAFSYGVSFVKLLAHMIEPFMPKISLRIFSMLNVDEKYFDEGTTFLPNNHKISSNIEVLFEKLDPNIVQNIHDLVNLSKN